MSEYAQPNEEQLAQAIAREKARGHPMTTIEDRLAALELTVRRLTKRHPVPLELGEAFVDNLIYAQPLADKPSLCGIHKHPDIECYMCYPPPADKPRDDPYAHLKECLANGGEIQMDMNGQGDWAVFDTRYYGLEDLKPSRYRISKPAPVKEDKPPVAQPGQGDPYKDENYWQHECARMNAVVGNLHADYGTMVNRVSKERDELKAKLAEAHINAEKMNSLLLEESEAVNELQDQHAELKRKHDNLRECMSDDQKRIYNLKERLIKDDERLAHSEVMFKALLNRAEKAEADLAQANDKLRGIAQDVIDEIGSVGPENADHAVGRLIAESRRCDKGWGDAERAIDQLKKQLEEVARERDAVLVSFHKSDAAKVRVAEAKAEELRQINVQLSKAAAADGTPSYATMRYAFDEFIDKTNWVQEDGIGRLGQHRADAIKEYVEQLKTQRDEALARAEKAEYATRCAMFGNGQIIKDLAAAKERIKRLEEFWACFKQHDSVTLIIDSDDPPPQAGVCSRVVVNKWLTARDDSHAG